MKDEQAHPETGECRFARAPNFPFQRCTALNAVLKDGISAKLWKHNTKSGQEVRRRETKVVSAAVFCWADGVPGAV